MGDLESGRIRELHDQQQATQKKSFTKWVNTHLAASSLKVDDLFEDLRDGRLLCMMLEIISGEKFPKLNAGKLKVQLVENVSIAMNFLKKKNIRLVSIGPQDVVDGNPDLTLGLVWSIILRFHITQIEIMLEDSDEKKYAKEALLLWSQRRTEGYANVQIKDFSGSWRDGLAFLALIHAHRPELLHFSDFKQADQAFNLETAFRVAEVNLGIARILDVEDMDKARPDEKSVMTYVAYYYHCFSQQDQGKRRLKKLNSAVGIDRLKFTYEGKVTLLMQWIRKQQKLLKDRTFPNTLEGIHELWLQLSKFRRHEFELRSMEYTEVIALISSVDGRMNELNKRTDNPRKSRLMLDLQKEWALLEDVLASRDAVLRKEVLHQEHLEKLANKFIKKLKIRTSHLQDMEEWLNRSTADDASEDITPLVVKQRHRKLLTVLDEHNSKESLYKKLIDSAQELMDQEHHKADFFGRAAEDAIHWFQAVQAKILEKEKSSSYEVVANLLRQLEALMYDLKRMKDKVTNQNIGENEMSVHNGLEQVRFIQLEVTVVRKSFNVVAKAGSKFKDAKDSPSKHLIQKLKQFHKEFKDLDAALKSRKASFETALVIANLQQDVIELSDWVEVTKKRLRKKILEEDYKALVLQREQIRLAGDEHASRKSLVAKIGTVLSSLKDLKQPGFLALEKEVNVALRRYRRMNYRLEVQMKRADRLTTAAELLDQLSQAECWLKERRERVTGANIGKTTLQVEEDFRQLGKTEAEVANFKPRLVQLQVAATKAMVLKSKPRSGLKTSQDGGGSRSSSSSGSSSSSDSEADSTPSRELVKINAPQVQALHSYNKKGVDMVKGDKLILVSSNDDGWSKVKKQLRVGYVPTSYINEVGQVAVTVKRKVPPQPSSGKDFVGLKKQEKDLNEKISNPLNSIQGYYSELQQACNKRRVVLEEAMQLLSFLESCTKFRSYIKELEKSVQAAIEGTSNKEESIRDLNLYTVRVATGEKEMRVIAKKAKKLVEANHKDLELIEKNYQETAVEWNRLIALQKPRDNKLADLSRADEFEAQCGELKIWMLAADKKMSSNDLGHNLTITLAYIIEHKRWLKEMNVMEKTMSAAGRNTVGVSAREETLDDLKKTWKVLKDLASTRGERLQVALKVHRALNEINDAMNWIKTTHKVINALGGDGHPKVYLKAHKELGSTLQTKLPELDIKCEVEKGSLGDSPLEDIVNKKLTQLTNEKGAIKKIWELKGVELHRCADLHRLNLLFSSMESVLNKQANYLEDAGNGDSALDVKKLQLEIQITEGLLETQRGVLSTMDDILLDLKKWEDPRLLEAKKKKNKIEKRLTVLFGIVAARRAYLDDTLSYFEFQDSLGTFCGWITEQMKVINVTVSKDQDDVEVHLKRHRYLQLEIEANVKHFNHLVKTGEQLILKKTSDANLAKSVDDLKKAWKELLTAATTKMLKLDQANAYCSFRSKLNQINYQFGKISATLSQDIDGLILPELKVMAKRHTKTEQDLKVVDTSVVELRTIGGAMIEYGHGAAQEIGDRLKEMDQTLAELLIGSEKRRVTLTFKIEAKQFTIDVEKHCGWIVHQMTLIKSKNGNREVKDAIDMVNQVKNVRLGMEVRKRAVDTTLQRGRGLDGDGAEAEVKAGITRLQSSWADLNQALDDASKHWELTLKLRRTKVELESSKTWVDNMTVYLETFEFGKSREDVKLIEDQLQLLTVQIHLKQTTADATKVWLCGLEIKESSHPEVQPLEAQAKELLQQLQDLKNRLQKAEKSLEAVLDLFYFLAETENLFGKSDGSVLAQERPFASTGFLQDLLQTANGIDGLPIHPELAAEISRRKTLLADKLERRNARRCSRSPRRSSVSSSSTSSSSDSSDEGGDMIDSKNSDKSSKNSRQDQWNANIDFLMHLINEKLQQTPDVIKPADIAETRQLESKQRVSEMDIAWMEPAVQRVTNDHRLLKLKRKISTIELDVIDGKQQLLSDKWRTLKVRLEKRKMTLFKALQLYQFINEVNVMSDFFTKLMDAMANPDVKRSIHDQLDAHSVVMSELSARESMLVEIQKKGHSMIAAEHFAKEKIKDLFLDLAEKKNRVLVEWHKRNDYLLQCFDLEKFQREAKNIEEALECVEKKLSVSFLPNTVQETYDMLNSHGILEKQLTEVSERLSECRLKADSMIQAKHFDAEGITQRTDGLQKKLQKVEYSVSVRKRTLHDQEAFIKFSASVSTQTEYLLNCEKVLELAVRRQQRIRQHMKKKTTAMPSSRRSSLSSKASSVKKEASKKSSLALFVDTLKQKFDSSDSDNSSSSSSSDSEKEEITYGSVRPRDEEALLNKARVKKLTLFKIFMEEFAARSKLIDSVETRGNEMLQQQHVASDRIKELLEALSDQQKRVKKAMEDHHYALELERDKTHFQAIKKELRRKIKEIESANPTGDKYNQDKEELLRLKSQLDLLADVHENFNQHYEDKVFDGIDSIVEELITKDTVHTNFFVQKKSDIKNSWKSAVNTLNSSRKLMEKTLDLLMFKENTNHLAEEITKLDNMLDSMDPSSGSIHEIAYHIRTFRTYVIPLMPLVSDKVEGNEAYAQNLGSNYPQDIKFITAIRKDVMAAWLKLKSMFDAKERLLEQANDVLKFEAFAKELEEWLNDMLKRVDTEYVFETVQQCELVIEGHEGLEVLLSSRKDDFAKFQETSNKYIVQAKEKAIAKKRVQAILFSKSKLEKALSARLKLLHDELLLLKFRSCKAKFEEELREKKRQAVGDIIANSVAAIELALHAQTLLHIDLGELEQLQKLVKQISKDTRETENLSLQLSRLVEEKNAVAAAIKRRGERLESQLALLQYRLEVDKVLPWIKEQLAETDATDSPTRPTQLNLVKEHLKTWASKVETTVKKGEDLLKANVNKKAVEGLMQDLQDSWQQLQDKAARDQAINDLKAKMKEYRSSSKELLHWLDSKLEGHDVGEEDQVEDLAELQEFLRTYIQLKEDGCLISTKVDELAKQRQELEQDHPGCFDEDLSEYDDFSDDEFDSGRVPLLEDEWASFRDTVEGRIEVLSRVKNTLELLSLHNQLMQWMTDLHDKIMQEIDEVDGGSADINLQHKKLEDVVKEIDRRASEVDKLLYSWESAKVDPLKRVARKEDLEEKFESLEAEWKALNKLASDRKAFMDHNLDAQEVLRKMQLLDEFLDRNEELVQEDDEMEKPVEELDEELKRLNLLLKQMEYYDNNFQAIKNKTFEELPECENGQRYGGRNLRVSVSSSDSKSGTSSDDEKEKVDAEKEEVYESAKSNDETGGSDEDKKSDEEDTGSDENENQNGDDVDTPARPKRMDRDVIVKNLVKEAEANLKKEQIVVKKVAKPVQAEKKTKTPTKTTTPLKTTTKKPKTELATRKVDKEVSKERKTLVVKSDSGSYSESSDSSSSSEPSRIKKFFRSGKGASKAPPAAKSIKNGTKTLKQDTSESDSDSDNKLKSEVKAVKATPPSKITKSKVVKPAVKPPVKAKSVQPEPVSAISTKSKAPENRSTKKTVFGGKKIGLTTTAKKGKGTKVVVKKSPRAAAKKRATKVSSSSSSSDSDLVDGVNSDLSEFEEETFI